MNVITWATGIHGYLWISAILFMLGILCMLARRNAIGLLLGVELILNAAAINFVAFSTFRTGAIDGQIFALFIILIAAAESAVGLAIVLRLFSLKQSIEPDDASLMRN